jgi:hypothetical protein
MDEKPPSTMPLELPTAEQHRELRRIAHERNWGLAFVLVGWLHLLAFSSCYYLTIVQDYHGSLGYLLIWVGELFAVWLIFRMCGGARRASQAAPDLERLIRRVWLAYFLLAFNLGSLNTLRGHHFFEFFPAMASLATFGLIMMTVVVDRRFFAAVVIMFCGGLLMATLLMHAYLIFAVAWWLVLNGIGVTLLRRERQPTDPDVRHPFDLRLHAPDCLANRHTADS